MDHTERMKRCGLAAVLFAVAVRLASCLAQSNIPTLLRELETGRNVRFSDSLPVFSLHFSESPPASPPEATEPPIPSFSGEEAVDIWYACDVSADIPSLLARPLQWDLTGEDPAVLILHTHSTESYTRKSERYTESASWRTLDENYNMLSIGARVGELLTEAGIGVIQDRVLHDYPSYNGSYVHARRTIRDCLDAHPSIRLVLDLHRDASGGGAQLRTLAEINGTASAQLMAVVGINHDGFEENLSLALKLHAQLEAQAPGITRPLQLRAQRFNQDLSPGALLIEVGAAGNSHAEALTAAEELAKAIIALARGTE